MLTKSVGLYVNLLCVFSPKKASKLAFQLFCKPRKGKLFPEKLPQILQDSVMETVCYGDNFFQTYTWKGNNEVILLVHGWESNASRWKKLLPYLKKSGKTIVAIDAPAHGLSSGSEFTVPKYTEAISEIIKKFNPNVLIGHSIGGAACIYYQFLYQNPKIDKMVLLGAPSDLKNLIINYCNMLSLNSKVQYHLEKTFSDKFKFSIDDFSAQKFGSHIITRALIIHDLHDEVVFVEEAQKILKNWENARFIQTSGLGHSLHNKKLYTQIQSFLLDENA